MDFTFSLEGEGGRRAAHRERVRGLVALWDGGGDRTYVVHDVSATGMSLVDPDGVLVRGREGRVTLAIGPRTLVTGLPVRVVRVTDAGLAGLAFGELTLRQEAWLDKLVLEIQKRRIDLRKARETADNPEDKKTDRADEQT
ncbi:PilZ domain-containing protein [Solidesulfovibrio sp.]|uniref:PilZ domain-containing protein n=1 Tax=Solidesulfovibrio sp. TaxID=2910990 RepID=UPI002602D345|nr:PilZ domain-containing protein [Solidesulfovibrio sp.]